MAKVRPGLARVLERGGRVTIVANTAAEFTDADAVRSLAELVADFPDRASAYLVGEDVFHHGKAYYVRPRLGGYVAGPGLGYRRAAYEMPRPTGGRAAWLASRRAHMAPGRPVSPPRDIPV
jgi:hypothetical protein